MREEASIALLMLSVRQGSLLVPFYRSLVWHGQASKVTALDQNLATNFSNTPIIIAPLTIWNQSGQRDNIIFLSTAVVSLKKNSFYKENTEIPASSCNSDCLRDEALLWSFLSSPSSSGLSSPTVSASPASGKDTDTTKRTPMLHNNWWNFDDIT